MVIPRSRSAFSLSKTQAYLKEPLPNSAASYDALLDSAQELYTRVYVRQGLSAQVRLSCERFEGRIDVEHFSGNVSHSLVKFLCPAPTKI